MLAYPLTSRAYTAEISLPFLSNPEPALGSRGKASQSLWGRVAGLRGAGAKVGRAAFF